MFPFIISSNVIATEHPTADIVVWRSFTFDNPTTPAARIKPNAKIKTIPGQINSHLE